MYNVYCYIMFYYVSFFYNFNCFASKIEVESTKIFSLLYYPQINNYQSIVYIARR